MPIGLQKTADISAKFQKTHHITVSGSNQVTEEVHKKLLMIQAQVEQYGVSKNTDIILEVVKCLDAIKMYLDPMDLQGLSVLLNAVQAKDIKKWKEYRWERIDTNSMKWNENNEPEKFTVRGISADDIMAITKREKDANKAIITLTLKMAGVYGLTNEILTRKSQQ